jgi:photosystem II stability/assembly factor-like uncharacterized protein
MKRLLGIAASAAAAALALGGTGSASQARLVPGLALFAGTSEGLWRSSDWGKSWERLAGGTSGATLDGLGAVRAIRPLGPQVWIGGDGGAYLSEDWGESWTQLSPTPGVSVVLPSRWPQADATVFVGTTSGLLRSRDGGRTLEPTALGRGGVSRIEWPGPSLLVACDGGLFVSNDEGAHFSGPGSGLPDAPVAAMVLSSFFGIDPVVFVAPRSGGVFRTSDGGTTWRSVGLAEDRVADLVWIDRFLYAAAEAALYRSEDAGATWTRLSSSPGRPTRLLFPLEGIEGFLATDRGVFHTPDAGQHWEPAGLAGQTVLAIATFPTPEPTTGKKRR